LTDFDEDVPVRPFIPDELVVLLIYTTTPALIEPLVDVTCSEIHIFVLHIPPHSAFTLGVVAVHP
jgi:hypothetical protein